MRHISALQSSVNQSFPHRWRWSPDGASGCLNGSDSPSTAFPSPAQLPAGPRQGARSWRHLFSSRNDFSPHPCNVLAAVGSLFQLAFNSPNASSHRGDPKLCRTSRNAKHLQWVTAAEVPARTLPDLKRDQSQQLQRLCHRQGPGERRGGPDWNEARKTWGKSCMGPLLWDLPTCFAWSCQLF